MENSTKALLVAAGVLIVIILVSISLLLFKNIGDTTEQAQNVGNIISETTGNASVSIIGGTKEVIISKTKFNEFINDYDKKYSYSTELLNQILNKQNKILKNQIQVIGYIYVDDYNKLLSERPEELKNLLKNFNISDNEKNKEIFNYEINVWVPKLLEEGKLIPLNNPADRNEIKEKLKEVYKNKKR